MEKTINRQPVVAGMFYDKDPGSLSRELKELYSYGDKDMGNDVLRALIVPHAGYIFSGQVAACAYRKIPIDKTYDTIFILGSSHHVKLDGASIYNKGDYITPLGKVNVNKDISRKLINGNELFSFQASAHAEEHSIEVQIPFLQHRLRNEFSIVPIIIGCTDTNKILKIAMLLAPYFNNRNLFIISSDFSHYPQYEDAKTVDLNTVNSILSNNPDNLLRQLHQNETENISNLLTSLCGWTSVLTLLNITSNCKDLMFEKIDYRNSGDVKWGNKKRVVGYASIGVFEKSEEKGMLTDEEKGYLLKYSRHALYKAVSKSKLEFQVDENIHRCLSDIKTGLFVTLYSNGKLRGCIGTFKSGRNLIDLVAVMTKESALYDSRFLPIDTSELDSISIEISILTPLKKINSIDEIELGKHGIFIKEGFRSGTFLPHVATKLGWDLKTTLGHCARDKAGIGWDGWRNADIFTYEAIEIKEER